MSVIASRSSDMALSWEIALPGRGRASLGAPKPRATLVVVVDEDKEHIVVPLAVGRLLASKQKSGEIHPSSRAELLFLVKELSSACAKARIERLIDRREYSREEVRRKLTDDGYASHTIDACLERACEVGLISDRRFADSYIRTKIAAGWGARRIQHELSRRGIAVEDLAGWPYEYFDPEDEQQRANQLALHHGPHGKHPFENLVRFLCHRGFSPSVAREAAHHALEDDCP